jgi:glutamine cyclotransferase
LLLEFLLLAGITGCQKESQETPGNLYLIGVQNESGSAIVQMRLSHENDDTLMAPTVISIDCFATGTTVFDPSVQRFGYMNCDSQFVYINSALRDTIQIFAINQSLSQVVLINAGEQLIGRYYDWVLQTDFITKIDLINGKVVANNSIYLKDGVYACSYFYRTTTGEYALVRSDSMILFINPDDGVTNDSLKLSNTIKNVIYDPELDRIIGFSYSLETDKNYIEVLDLATGMIISKAEIKISNDYLACEASYDPETNSYTLLNSKDEMLFLDIDSGRITESYSFMSHIREFKIWRGE